MLLLCFWWLKTDIYTAAFTFFYVAFLFLSVEWRRLQYWLYIPLCCCFWFWFMKIDIYIANFKLPYVACRRGGFLNANIYAADFRFPHVTLLYLVLIFEGKYLHCWFYIPFGCIFFWFLMKVDICIDDFKFPYIVLFIIILFMFNNLNWAL